MSTGNGRHIQVLVPPNDQFPGGGYFATGLVPCWEEMGFRVTIARGLDQLSDDADLVLPHIDLTVTPPEYREVLDRLPNVVNRGVYDISKRFVSDNLLQPDDDWDGPVIIKTNANFAGRPERRHLNQTRSRAHALGRKIRRHLHSPAKRRMLLEIGNSHYPIFDRLADVPRWAFRRHDVVVERFLPEQDDKGYYVRYWLFVGDRYRCIRMGARDPVVKSATRSRFLKEDGLPVPDEVRAYRARLRLEYGKIDFVLHHGRPVVIDVNRTPGGPPPERLMIRCPPLAPGILPLLDRTGPPVWERAGVATDAAGDALNAVPDRSTSTP